MPISPANNLNIKTLTISQLAAVSTPLGSNDYIQISQYQGGVYYSRKSTLDSVTTYVSNNLQNNLTGSFNLKNTAGTFGDDNFLPIKINGTTYKIPLYPNS